MNRYTPLGLAGRLIAFIAKGSGTHSGTFSQYSITGLPGRRRVFVAKTGIIVTEAFFDNILENIMSDIFEDVVC